MASFRVAQASAPSFLKGQVMELSQGKANPAFVGEVFGAEAESVVVRAVSLLKSGMRST